MYKIIHQNDCDELSCCDFHCVNIHNEDLYDEGYVLEKMRSSHRIGVATGFLLAIPTFLFVISLSVVIFDL